MTTSAPPTVAAMPETLPPGAPPAPERSTLVQAALEALTIATQRQGEEGQPAPFERAVFRPDSWLIQKCWETLADAGAPSAALAVAQMAGSRQPLAPVQALYRLSAGIDKQIGLANVIAQELKRMTPQILAPAAAPDDVTARDRLLYAAATAAAVGNPQLALTCLERLDQFATPWERPVVVPEQRQMLSDTVFELGLHPLTMTLITSALRRYGDAGAQFVLNITTAAGEQLRERPAAATRVARQLMLGVDTFRNATLTSLHSRRLTAIALAQAGAVDEVLGQLTAIANIQAARRESGLSLRKGDQSILRQVKRPTADADVDFQVYTLQEAVRAMPVRQMPREQRIDLANRLAMLGTKSDGWTAAGAAATLIDLGAVKFAIDVVDSIPANDPTKAEGFIALAKGLLGVDEPALAEEQIRKGLAWVQAYPGRNPERALIWGVAQAYLERGEPDNAVAILDTWQEPAGFWRSVRDLFGRKLSDDELRNSGLRLRALLLQDAPPPKAVQQQVSTLMTWAPRLLDGEALVNFLSENVLEPLLAAGRVQMALQTLPVLQQAVQPGSGEKHADRLTNLANVLVAELGPELSTGASQANGQGDATRAALENFVTAIWAADRTRGLWQTVYGIEGMLPLVAALEGPDALVALARGVAQAGSRWSD
ncbi:MAG: hypothetical protein M9936_03900 [Caldilinea sp.]|nr:hypothetical protein [Caldilinea sp.]MCB9116267.1 hypothetical protein [Caldilineaceae bacterium]MCB9122110.1 hypothetical protein [Caldilineaceae bacterium]MCO5208813.1 hypothetical protein [Caldilinea sp.]MCW5841096.1 hypothetical protein [Caldilinea sp.]